LSEHHCLSAASSALAEKSCQRSRALRRTNSTFEPAVGAFPREDVPNVLVVVRRELSSELEDQGLAESELVLVGYLDVFFVVDIVGKFVLLHGVDDFGMVVQSA
jgi:hypothetical protein